MLRALPGNAVVLGLRDLELTAVERHQRLHGAFAEGLVADDDAATVVLNGTGEDLARTRTELIGDDHKRAIPNCAGVVIFDALGTPALSELLLEKIRAITDEPIVRVIVSHYHADHIYGLQVFEDLDAEILADVYLAMTGGQGALSLDSEVDPAGGDRPARARVERVYNILDSIKIGPERVRMYNLSAGEGAKFAQFANEFVGQIRELGQSPINVVRNKEAQTSSQEVET